MTLVIGTDEAGYGPNLGPLVVAASAWRLDGPPAAAEAAFAAVAAAPLWGDSKIMYRSGTGLAALERGVHVALDLAGTPATHWAGLAAALGPIDPDADALDEWCHLDGLVLPHAAAVDDCRRSADARAALAEAGLTLVGVAARAVYPAEFNRLLDSGFNKADVLSRTTLDLAAALRDRFSPTDTVCWCDRHGGRKSYAALVGRHFAAPLVRELEETPARSAYMAPAARLWIEFSVGGEARLPVAVASMTAKYVRELAMAAFNRFWSERVPGLVPTAGYPADARRWSRDTAEAVRAAGIAADRLWRRA